ncbi:putative leucine-rich repeat domain, L domain-containing protein [Medicago truncatula]|nr:putative disease resistance protein At3g14460 [Medicago truncatula]RHN65663.1 putative leucine-rich repeat domain, L domain-containing protein [Medicago truncatula]
MKSIKRIGTEFTGSISHSFQPFSFLETLEFDTMLEWEDWKLIGGTTAEFPRLKRLSLRQCPKLKGNLPLGQLQNLEEIILEGMKSLKTLDTGFYGSSSSRLFQPFPFLKTLSFTNMQEWEEWKLIGGASIEFPSLTRLLLCNCPKLKGNIPGNLPSLTSLSLKYCPNLKQMSPNNFPSLVELELEDCSLLMEARHSSDVFNQLMIFLNALRNISLRNIPSLTSFPRNGLPKTIQSLKIWKCENLEFLPYESFHNYKSLEHLEISDSCNSMTSFTVCALPVLRSLCIYGSKNLKSILIAEDVSQQKLLLLRTIKIEHCDELESFSLGGFPIPNLIHLSVCNCKKLYSLPRSINILASLEEMKIHDLPNLQSFSIHDFPISLRELSVGNVGGVLWNTTWERLTSLLELLIWGDDIVNVLMKTEVPLLPASLVSLKISLLEDIKCLDGKWLQHLTSLQHFDIIDAPKLKSLPKKGKLPSSLKVLNIKKCPLLKASWQKKRGKEWRKIAHIPSVLINGQMIT